MTALSARKVARFALMAEAIDKPVLIKLGLEDDRTLTVRAWTVRDGQLVLTLDEGHDFFPVAHYVLGAPGRVALRTATLHRQRGMYATDAERASSPKGGE